MSQDDTRDLGTPQAGKDAPEAVERELPGRTTVIRPGLIVGPGDETDRFSYWPLRVQRGGDAVHAAHGLHQRGLVVLFAVKVALAAETAGATGTALLAA